jgi:hypothetical protein
VRLEDMFAEVRPKVSDLIQELLEDSP